MIRLGKTEEEYKIKMLNIDFTSVFSGLLGWGIVGILAYRIYKKQLTRPRFWKIFIVILIGMFSFSFSLPMYDTIFNIPILPLGVWILYLFLKGKKDKWQRYRPFAWLGFFANFIFLLSSLIALPVYYVIYPKNEPSTYLSNVENASIVHTHPSAKNFTLNNKKLEENLHSLKENKFYSDEWYEKTYMSDEANKRDEWYPYHLIGAKSKWGSGLETMIYIEDDGKGILISTPKYQLYFRSETTLLEGEK